VAETLCQALRDLADARPNALALIGEKQDFTWATLDEMVANAAGVLRAAGVKPGDVVGLMLPRTPELAVGFLAIARLGAVAVPINHKLRARWIDAQMDGLSVIIVDPLLESGLSGTGSSGAVRLVPGDLMERAAEPIKIVPNVTPDTVCYLNCTSGSTGRPKRAATTHAQILANARATVAASRQGGDDVFWCLFASFAHPHEFFHRSLVSGAAFVMIETMSPRVVSRTVVHRGVSHMLVLPGFAELWLDSGHLQGATGHLKRVEAGGSVVTPDLHERMGQVLHGTFAAVWGSTETTGVAVVSSEDGGEVLQGYEMRVVGDGVAVSQGEVGELWLSGPAVVTAYTPKAQGQSSPFSDGWFQTGDLVRVDHLGRLHFLGRCSTLLKVGGARVYPAEVERVLRAHPLVTDAVVVGIPDRRRGEVPIAMVVAAPELQQEPGRLRAHCRECLAGYKVPRHIVFVSEIPRLPGGKVDRQAVLEQIS